MAERGRTDSRRPGTTRRGGVATAPLSSKKSNPQRGVAKTAAKPQKPAPPSGTRFTARAGILMVVMLLLVASYTSSFNAWWNQRQEIAALELRKAVAQDEIAELTDIEKRWQDPAFIRNQARERFGWVMPGEVGYRVIGLDGELKGDGPTLDAPAALPEPTWIDRLQSSIAQVDHPQEAGEVAETDPDAVLKKKKGS